jgi:hypothetical protein
MIIKLDELEDISIFTKKTVRGYRVKTTRQVVSDASFRPQRISAKVAQPRGWQSRPHSGPRARLSFITPKATGNSSIV